MAWSIGYDWVSTSTADTYNETGSGGVVCGGVATVTASTTLSVGGGVETGGLATVGNYSIYHETGSGGATVSGLATASTLITVGGGVLCSGTLRWSKRARTSCYCNRFLSTASGGAEAGGTSTITIEQYAGRVVCGGKADVNIPNITGDEIAAWYHLWDVGQPFVDSSQFGLDGSCLTDHCPEYTEAAPYCTYAQSFDGTDWIEIPADHLEPHQDFTVSFWAYYDDVFKNRVWYSRGSNTPNRMKSVFSVGYSVVGHVIATINLTDGVTTTEYTAFSTTLLTRERWYHIAVSWTPGDALRIYVDGVLAGSVATTETETLPVVSVGYVGRQNMAVGIVGDMTELRVWPEAKSAAWLLAEHDNYCSAEFITID